MQVVKINPKILKELKELKPTVYYNYKKKFPRIDKWILDLGYPTYKQLEQLSKIFNVPIGYFFLDELPKIPLTKVIYISGAISNDPKYVEKFDKWKEILSKSYPTAEIMSPNDFVMASADELMGKDNKQIWAEAMLICLQVLRTCTDIFVIPENIPSVGKEIEILFADYLGLNFISPYEV
jgi:hypothetical protein